MSEKLKFDYLNEKSFRSQIKTFFLVSQVLAFRRKKQISKNVADTTFKIDARFCEIHIYHAIYVLYYTDLKTFLGRGINQFQESYYIPFSVFSLNCLRFQ